MATKKRRSARKPASRKRSTAAGSRPGLLFGPSRPRVDLRVAHGSITEADSRAVVLGLFQGVTELSGAAQAIDRRMDGTITEILHRRMFAGTVGEIFILPAARHDIRADLVVCVGMGRFDAFEPKVLHVTAENVARTLVRASVDDFATVLFGASRGNLKHGMTHLVDGFFRGVRDTRARNPLRSITVCETDLMRCNKIEQAIVALYGTKRSEHVEVTLERISLPSPPDAAAAGAPGSVILQTTQEPGTGSGTTKVRISVLGAGTKAAVPSASRELKDSVLDKLIAEVNQDEFLDNDKIEDLERYGKKLARQVLPKEISSILEKIIGRRLVVVHDQGTSRIPWETLCVKGRFPAAEGGMSRQHLAEHMPVARWLEERRYGDEIDLLLIVNPTEDLKGAAKEGRIVREAVRGLAGIKITELRGRKATKERVKEEIESGAYDILHYAGHTAFWPDDPSQTGIVCSHHEVLTGDELSALRNLPALVFFNSCESGRVGGLAQQGTGVQRTVGLAEAFLRGGVANYVGTHWEVSDAAAPAFMTAFYGALMRGETIGRAVSDGRQAVRKEGSRDWADYIHYGDPGFALKFPRGATS